MTSTSFTFTSSNIIRNIAITVHRLRNFISNNHQYFEFINRIIRFRIDEICKQYFSISNFNFFIDRTRSTFFFEKFELLRFWSSKWIVNKTHIRKTIKKFEIVTIDLLFIIEKNKTFTDETLSFIKHIKKNKKPQFQIVQTFQTIQTFQNFFKSSSFFDTNSIASTFDVIEKICRKNIVMSKFEFQFNQIDFFNSQIITFFDTQNQNQKQLDFDFNSFEFNVRLQFEFDNQNQNFFDV